MTSGRRGLMVLGGVLVAGAAGAGYHTQVSKEAIDYSAKPGVSVSEQRMADGFWRVTNADGRWRAVDPSGRSTAILGVDHVQWRGMACQALGGRRLYHEHNLTNYASKAEWETETVGRLRSWGFNSLGAGCDEALRGRGLAAFRYLRVSDEFCRGDHEHFLCEYRFAPCTAFPNVFGRAFAVRCEEIARQVCGAARNDSDLLGYFIDNELAWNGGGRGPSGLFDVADELDAAHSAKRALEAFLAERVKGGRAAFAALGTAEREKVKADFVRLVAERYFATAVAAIRRHDPNHLVFGCRFAGLDGAPPCVWEVAGKYSDVVTFNCYPWAELRRNVVLDRRGGRPVADCFRDIHARTSRPLMVTEWSFPALDAGMPCLHGAGQRFFTQGERATASELFARTMLSLPFVVGYDYFMWVDEPALGMNRFFPEDSNYGLVSERGVPYRELTTALARLHESARLGNVSAPSVGRAGTSRPRGAQSERTKYLGATRLREPVTFTRTGDAWTLVAAHGITLTGRVGGRVAVDGLSIRGRNYGRIELMVQTRKDTRASDWFDVTRVEDVRGASGGGTGQVEVVCLAERKGVPQFRLQTHLTLAAGRRDLLLEVVSLRNLTEDAVAIENILVRPFADDVAPEGRRLPLDLWRGDRDCRAEWRYSDGRRLEACSGDESALHFGFWRDEKGDQHPDARFGWDTPRDLGSRKAVCFGETMGLLLSCCRNRSACP